jgi:hypothetical protein
MVSEVKIHEVLIREKWPLKIAALRNFDNGKEFKNWLN